MCKFPSERLCAMKVLNKRDVGAKGVYIGRGSPWGNPFVIGIHGDRDDVIYEYRHWMMEQWCKIDGWLEPLIGKDLLCYCAPLRCHGDVLIELIETHKLGGK